MKTLADYYRAGLAIVGNSGCLTGAGYGPEIDAHPNVVRFNTCHTAGHETDTGCKITIWAISGFDSAKIGWHPADVELTCLVMPVLHRDYRARYSLNPALLPKDVPFRQIPVERFRQLTRLCPNPSSGVSFCFWLWSEIGEPFRASCLYGFSHFAPDVPYHYFSDVRPEITTHSMAHEKRLFAAMTSLSYPRWRAEK